MASYIGYIFNPISEMAEAFTQQVIAPFSP